MKKRRIITWLLTVALVFSRLPSVFAAQSLIWNPGGTILPAVQHANVHASEMEHLTFDLSEFEQHLRDLQRQAKDGANGDLVQENVREIREMFIDLNTILTWRDLDTCRDITDQKAYDAYDDTLSMYYDAEALLMETLPQVAESPCSIYLDLDDPYLGQYYEEMDSYTEEELALLNEEQQLMNAYQQKLDEPIEVTQNGETYTFGSLDQAYYEGTVDDIQYDDILLKLVQRENSLMADNYIALVNNRNRQAEYYGIDNYCTLSDDYVYYRDYHDGARERFYENIKELIVPVMVQLGDQITVDAIETGYQDTVFTSEELLSTLEKTVGNISEELLPALDYIEEYGYYDIELSDTKVPGARTVFLDTPNAPYLLMRPEGTGYDFSSLVHEYGHTAAYFCNENPNATNLDLAEIHSQGLELLMTFQYGTVFGENALVEEETTVYYLIQSLVDGCMYDELERYAYTEENLTVEKMNRKYMELLKDYGYRDQDDPEELAYGWVENGHMFSSPLYYISYAVSASGAFEIWRTSLTDMDGAVEQYLTLMAKGETGWFQDTLNQAGIAIPFREKTIRGIAESIAARYGLAGDGGHREAADTIKTLIAQGQQKPVIDSDVEKTVSKSFMVIGIAALLFAGLLLCVAIRSERKGRNRKNDKTGNSLYRGTDQTTGTGGEADGDSGSAPSPECGEAWGSSCGESDACPGTDDPSV